MGLDVVTVELDKTQASVGLGRTLTFTAKSLRHEVAAERTLDASGTARRVLS